MKLFLMRHAQAENSLNRQKEDSDRILTEKGREEGAEAGLFLKKHLIDKFIVSYTLRTIETANIIGQYIFIKEKQIVEELYNNSYSAVMDNIITNQDNKNKNILILGHNPLIYQLAMDLSHVNSKNYEYLIETNMPSARIIVISFEELTDWSEIDNHRGNIIEIFTPS